MFLLRKRLTPKVAIENAEKNQLGKSTRALADKHNVPIQHCNGESKMDPPKKLDGKPYLLQIRYTSLINHNIFSQIKPPDYEHILVIFFYILKMFSRSQNTFCLNNKFHTQFYPQGIFSHCQRKMNKTNNIFYQKVLQGKDCFIILLLIFL